MSAAATAPPGASSPPVAVPGRGRWRRATAGLWLVALALAGLSLLGPAQPSYDPWAWLLWGRELAGGALSTEAGPAFKPLPVAVTTAFAPLGADVAPVLWLWVARAAAIASVLLAGRVAWRLGGGWAGAGLAGAGVAATGGVVWHGAVGHVELGALALALAAVDRTLGDRDAPPGRPGRPTAALGDVLRRGDEERRPGTVVRGRAGAMALLVGVALLRVEAWPFVLGLALWWWPRHAGRVALGAAAVLAAWFVPEWLGSGDVLRSGARAQVPNPGQPATAAVPGLASLAAAAGIAAWPVVLGALAAPRGVPRVLAVVGVGWVALVAVMAQAGFSGEPRYALPGVALLAVPGALGWARAPRWAVVPVAAAALVLATPGHVADARRVADEAQLHGALDDVVARAGGRDAVLRCGRPATGRYRGPAVAYALDVPKRLVRTPGAGGATFRSRLRRSRPVEPADAPGRVLARSARWELRCAGR